MTAVVVAVAVLFIASLFLLVREWLQNKENRVALADKDRRIAELEGILERSGYVIEDKPRPVTPEEMHEPSWTGEDSALAPERPAGTKRRWDEGRSRQR